MCPLARARALPHECGREQGRGNKWFHLGDTVHRCDGVMRVTAADVA